MAISKLPTHIQLFYYLVTLFDLILWKLWALEYT
jgi:hypothetical protein